MNPRYETMKSHETAIVRLHTRRSPAIRIHGGGCPYHPMHLWHEASLPAACILFEHGKRFGWKRLPYSVCSAVAEGEHYWQLFAVTHGVGELGFVKEAILRAEQSRAAGGRLDD